MHEALIATNLVPLNSSAILFILLKKYHSRQWGGTLEMRHLHPDSTEILLLSRSKTGTMWHWNHLSILSTAWRTYWSRNKILKCSGSFDFFPLQNIAIQTLQWKMTDPEININSYFTMPTYVLIIESVWCSIKAQG